VIYLKERKDMQRGPHLAFNCVLCEKPVTFSVWEVHDSSYPIICNHCQKKYLFSADMLKQLKQFEALCLQIQQSEEILGSTHVAIDIGPYNVKVPYRLLLTRLSSVMNLSIGDKKLEIAFRTEPLIDCKNS
jgi:hypothetical protein